MMTIISVRFRPVLDSPVETAGAAPDPPTEAITEDETNGNSLL